MDEVEKRTALAVSLVLKRQIATMKNVAQTDKSCKCVREMIEILAKLACSTDTGAWLWRQGITSKLSNRLSGIEIFYRKESKGNRKYRKSIIK